MPDFREVFQTEAEMIGFVSLLKRHDGPMPMFVLLSKVEQSDVVEGRCVYRQHGHMPILDYTGASHDR